MNIQQRKTKDGKTVWQAQVDVGTRIDPKTGKEERVRDYGTFDTKADAARWWKERKARAKADRQVFVQPSKEPLKDFLAGWLERKRQEGLKPSTLDSYERTIRVHVIPAIGTVPLADLSPAAVQGMMDLMGKKPRTGPKTVGYTRSILRMALQDALRLGTLALNPCDRVKGPRQAPRRVEAFTQEQLYLLFEKAKGTRMEFLFPFAAYSGLRRGELLALRWEDVDFAKGTVTVRRGMVQEGGHAVVMDEPKTKAGRRTLTLPLPCVEALRAQRDMQLADKKTALAAGKAGEYRQEGWVFATATGGILDPNRVSRDYRRIRDHAGLPKTVPFHGLRHTAVSLRMAALVPLAIITKQIGHRKTGFTADVYGHLLPEADRAATDVLNAFLGAKKSPGNSSPAGK